MESTVLDRAIRFATLLIRGRSAASAWAIASVLRPGFPAADIHILRMQQRSSTFTIGAEEPTNLPYLSFL